MARAARRRRLPLIPLTSALLALSPAHADGICVPPQLSAQAEGFVEAVPDIVTISVTVSHTAPTLAEAKQRVDAIGNGVIRAADLHGIGPRDLQASKIQAAPDYDWNNGMRVLRGQQVSRQFELKLRDIDRYGALVQALADAEVTQINSIDTEFSTIDKLEQQALKKAIANVRGKAAEMAAGFDRKIVGVIAVNEEGSGRPQPHYELRADFAKAQMAGGNGGAALKVGPQRISKRVAVTFRLDGDCVATLR
jgi:uncharacterized protein YggE